MKRNTFLVSLCIVSLLGASSLIFATKLGVGTAYDSAIYIGAARNLLDGKGLTIPFISNEAEPMTHYPPLFPVLLSAIGFLGIDPMAAARWVNVFVFGANIFLVGLVISRFTHGSPWTALFGSLLTASSAVVLWIHLWASTDPLFILLGLAGIFLMHEYLEKKGQPLLICSAVLIALAFLTRYSGIALVCTGAIGILLLSPKTLFEKARDSCVFLAISSLPVALWLVRNVALSGNATDRSAAFHPITATHLRLALENISAWILPTSVPDTIRMISALMFVTVAAAAHVFLSLRKKKQAEGDAATHYPSRFHSLAAIFIITYGALLVISISFFDTYIPLDDRILSPIHVFGMIITLCIGYQLLSLAEGMKLVKISAVAVCTLFLAFYLSKGESLVTSAHDTGLGLAGREWQDNPDVKQLRELTPDVHIYSNKPYAIYLLSGRSASRVPGNLNDETGKTNESYPAEVAAMNEQLRNKKAVVINFDVIPPQWGMLLEKESDDRPRLSPADRSAE